MQFSLLSCGEQQLATKAACDDLGLKLIAYSPLALGMLTGRYSRQGDGALPAGGGALLQALARTACSTIGEPHMQPSLAA